MNVREIVNKNLFLQTGQLTCMTNTRSGKTAELETVNSTRQSVGAQSFASAASLGH